MGRKVRYFSYQIAPYLKLLAMAAVNGAIAGFATQLAVPEFHTKPTIVAAAILLSAGKAVVNIMAENPLGQQGRRGRPRPQQRPRR